jgi:hypothetical protein
VLSTFLFLAHYTPSGGEVGEEEDVLCGAVLAAKLIHLPDEPAGVGQIGTQTVEGKEFCPPPPPPNAMPLQGDGQFLVSNWGWRVG